MTADRSAKAAPTRWNKGFCLDLFLLNGSDVDRFSDRVRSRSAVPGGEDAFPKAVCARLGRGDPQGLEA